MRRHVGGIVLYKHDWHPLRSRISVFKLNFTMPESNKKVEKRLEASWHYRNGPEYSEKAVLEVAKSASKRPHAFLFIVSIVLKEVVRWFRKIQRMSKTKLKRSILEKRNGNHWIRSVLISWLELVAIDTVPRLCKLLKPKPYAVENLNCYKGLFSCKLLKWKLLFLFPARVKSYWTLKVTVTKQNI